MTFMTTNIHRDLPSAREDEPRILGLFAHPDDETFCAGATFAKYAAQGVETMAVSATRGQAGQIRDAGVATRRTLAEVREREMRLACQRLGIQHVECLDYLDGALQEADREQLVGDLIRIMRAFRPTTVITFGPDGGYGHPDHIAISEATTDAWDRAGDPCQFPGQIEDGLRPYTPSALDYAYFPPHRMQLLDRLVRWIVASPQHFKGDGAFIQALLAMSEEASMLRYTSDHYEVGWFPPGSYVVEQGEASTTLYLILSGEADAIHEHEDGALETLERLGPGQFFGVRGLAEARPHYAHIVARSGVTCLVFAPAAPTKFVGRGQGAHITLGQEQLAPIEEVIGDATARIDGAEYVDQKIAALSAYRSQYPLQPDTLPRALLLEMFGIEYFVQARPCRGVEAEIVRAMAKSR